MTSTALQLHIHMLERLRDALTDEFNQVIEALVNTADPVVRVRLERQSEAKLAEIRTKDEEIAKLKREAQDQPVTPDRGGGRGQPRWDQHLHFIDFQGVISSFERIVWPPAHLRQRTAMLLFQNSKQMCGELLVQRLREQLAERNRMKQRASLHLHEVVFTAGKTLSAGGLLAELGKSLGLTPLPDTPLPAVVERLLRPLQTHSVLLLAIRVLGDTGDRAAAFSDFAPWFVDTFWSSLRAALAEREDRLPFARAIAAVAIDLPTAPQQLDATLCCTADQFHDQRLTKLPLSNWQLDDIASWLADYSTLASQPDQIELEAQGVFANSNSGVPWLVRYELGRIL
jgi:hypothetical protein